MPLTAWLFGLALLAPAPRVLIVQSVPAVEPGAPQTELVLDSYLANEFEEDGRVVPIVWSLSDPVFRGAVDRGELDDFDPTPDEKQIRVVATKLRVDFVLTISAVRQDGQVRPVAKLHRGALGRVSWSFGVFDQRSNYKPVVMVDGRPDEQRTKELQEKFGAGGTMLLMSVMVNGLPDWDATARSIARTWNEMLAATSFKPYPRQPKIDTPGTDVGTPGGTGVRFSPEELAAPVETAKRLRDSGRTDAAILLLRDAIDRNPFEPTTRRLLAEILIDQGLFAEAGREARRAATLQPASTDLWLMAAKAWVLALNPEEAQADVNQALARNGNAVASHSLLGDIYLLQSRFADAIEAYSKSIAVGPTIPAVIGRCLAYALDSQAELSEADIKSLNLSDPAAIAHSYAVMILLTDRAYNDLTKTLRNLPINLRVKPKDAELTDEATIAERRISALTSLLTNFPVPGRHEKSHQGRLLAYKLLLQSSQEALEFARSNDEDAAAESVISLGESLKIIPIVREQYAVERTTPSSLLK